MRTRDRPRREGSEAPSPAVEPRRGWRAAMERSSNPAAQPPRPEEAAADQAEAEGQACERTSAAVALAGATEADAEPLGEEPKAHRREACGRSR